MSATRTILFIGAFVIDCFKKKKPETVKDYKAFDLIFSVLLSVSIIVGYHIHIENVYSGNIDTEYITSYNCFDVVSIIMIIWIIYHYVSGLRRIISTYSNTLMHVIEEDGDVSKESAISIKTVAVGAIPFLIIVLLYLMIYYPGFVFGDTLGSIAEKIEYGKLSNHHPVLYTVFVKSCLALGRKIGGGNSLGCAIYCVIQSVYYGFGLSYICCWMQNRFNIKKGIAGIYLLFMALTPYVMTYSIAMWKDPVFIITLAIISVMNFDYMNRRIKTTWKNLIVYVILILIVLFVRNNGFHVIMMVELIWAIIFLLNRKDKSVLRILVVTLCTLLFYSVVTGPIYETMGVKKVKAESLGIFINQMARVATYEGKMTDDEKEYMDSLLPLSKYKSTYRPDCVDMLKWDKDFNNDVLENDFFKYWFSIGIKNPKYYLESWEMMTAGYWAINVPYVNRRQTNISSGVPTVLNDQYVEIAAGYDIHSKNLLKREELKELFITDEWSVPASWIHWLLLYIIGLLLIQKKYKILPLLAPSIGVTLTLLVASPITYWPRYCYLEQLMLPIYMLILFYLLRSEIKSEYRKD